ncbi:acyltransferase [Fructilactobacillus fructivorans]|uniref:Acyltransferase 3 n=1 Tax=Fructilactobacillus fructivorans TaxID=1614 RepID=A0A0C1PQX5_9LACO|nr:acyltransferase [Fructilactobacillus fructivorans]KID42276.1 acyltransferase 3 [Fructilactobacillus fructivorans]MCT0151103.1 acyltransferase [Fructilactobacillus fructivorans]MCT2867339.1 acyltransferase [Fructilactobacillus fructivorans]MCT2869142.1 acyltransferase [Fructilactobacillus fructivorans]MCT2873138.1 acyltransferase [Fructilactobacillus fructivorans]
MKKRLTYIDVINIIAIIFVLFIHSSWNYNNNALGIFDSIIRTIAVPAVFLFVMNSGATLLGYRDKYDTQVFFKKRFFRVMIPLIVWSIIYYLVDAVVKTPLPDVNFVHHDPSVENFFTSFFSGSINGAFWFFYCIIALYFITPVLSVLARNHKSVLFYLVVLDFLVNYIFIYLNTNWFHMNLSLYIFPIASTSYVGFFIMGYLIRVGYFDQKWLKITKWVALAALVISLVISLFIFKDLPASIMNLKENGGPLLFLYVIGIYLWIKDFVESHKVFVKQKFQNLLAKMASVSLGIYILHPFFLKLFMVVTKTTFDSWLDILVMPLFTYVVCGLVVYVIKKIPFMKDILP